MLRREAPPKPDYSVTTDDGQVIGIELTEVFHSQGSKRLSSIKGQIGEGLAARLSSLLPFKVRLSIDLDPFREVIMAKEYGLVEKLAKICADEFFYLEDGGFGEVSHIDESEINDIHVYPRLRSQGYRDLPSGIASVRIGRCDRLPRSEYRWNEGGIVPDLTLEFIQPIVKKKESKLRAQSEFNQHWLVIREGNYFTGSFNNIIIAPSFQSLFDKLIVYRSALDEVVEFK